MDYLKRVINFEDSLRVTIIFGCALGVLALALLMPYLGGHSGHMSHNNQHAAHSRQ